MIASLDARAQQYETPLMRHARCVGARRNRAQQDATCNERVTNLRGGEQRVANLTQENVEQEQPE